MGRDFEPYVGMTGVDTWVCLELKNVLFTPEKGLLFRAMIELSIDTSFICIRRVLIVVEYVVGFGLDGLRVGNKFEVRRLERVKRTLIYYLSSPFHYYLSRTFDSTLVDCHI